MMKQNLDKKTLFLVFVVIFLVLTLPIAIWLSQQRQDIRNRASSEQGTAIMKLVPASGSPTLNNDYEVQVKFSAPPGAAIDTGTGRKGVIGVQAILKYTYTGTSPLKLETVDVIPGFTTTDWVYYFKDVVVTGTNTKTATIRINALYNNQTTPYSAITEATFAKLIFHPQANGSITVNIDPTLSFIKVQTDNEPFDILKTPTIPAGTYTVGGGSTPTPTEEATALTPTPTATVIPTPTPTRPPTAPTITRFSTYCGTVSSAESESVLVLYGSKFGATRDTSKVTFHYKSNSAATEYQDKDVTDYVSWSDSIVVVKVPAVTFPKDSSGVDQASVVAKVVIKTAAEPTWPFTFPALDNFAFFEITHNNPKSIGDVNCSGWVNLRDYTILGNNYDKDKEEF